MSMTPSRRVLDSLTIADLAVDNRLYVVRCNLCKRTRHFLARDLEDVYGGEIGALGLFTHCSKCGKSEWLHVSTRLPDHNDVGHLVVTRPVNGRMVWTWSDSFYEEEPPTVRRPPGLWGG